MVKLVQGKVIFSLLDMARETKMYNTFQKDHEDVVLF